MNQEKSDLNFPNNKFYNEVAKLTLNKINVVVNNDDNLNIYSEDKEILNKINIITNNDNNTDIVITNNSNQDNKYINQDEDDNLDLKLDLEDNTENKDTNQDNKDNEEDDLDLEANTENKNTNQENEEKIKIGQECEKVVEDILNVKYNKVTNIGEKFFKLSNLYLTLKEKVNNELNLNKDYTNMISKTDIFIEDNNTKISVKYNKKHRLSMESVFNFYLFFSFLKNFNIYSKDKKIIDKILKILKEEDILFNKYKFYYLKENDFNYLIDNTGKNDDKAKFNLIIKKINKYTNKKNLDFNFEKIINDIESLNKLKNIKQKLENINYLISSYFSNLSIETQELFVLEQITGFFKFIDHNLYDIEHIEEIYELIRNTKTIPIPNKIYYVEPNEQKIKKLIINRKNILSILINRKYKLINFVIRKKYYDNKNILYLSFSNEITLK